MQLRKKTLLEVEVRTQGDVTHMIRNPDHETRSVVHMSESSDLSESLLIPYYMQTIRSPSLS